MAVLTELLACNELTNPVFVTDRVDVLTELLAWSELTKPTPEMAIVGELNPVLA